VHKRQLPRFMTTREIMDRTGIKTIGGVIKFLKREKLDQKIGGRYRVSRRKLQAHWPAMLDD